MDPPSRKPKIRRVKKSVHLLPPEVVEEILARLPVKSLLRFRCVSKSWRFSIDSRFFVNKRLRSSAEWKVISNDTALDDDPNKHLMTDSTLLGSLNGLLCILKQNSFFLWNPTTRISIELPKLEFQSTKYGFGWDECSDAYKVFVIVSEQDQKIGKVYSTLTNSWKTVEHGCLSVRNRYGFRLCGNIHWLTESGDRIESFDLKSEVFGTMELPFESQGYIRLKEIVGCLGVTCDNDRTRLDVWVMKKYGVNESWVKQNTAPIPLEYKYDYYNNYRLQYKGGIKFFWRKTNGGDNGVKKYHYVESLVSPVFTPRQEIEQEQVPAIPIVDDQPKPQIKRKPGSLNKKRRPARQNKRRAAVVEVSKESGDIVPKRQSKRRAANVEVSKEVVPMRQSKRRPAGVEISKEVVEVSKEVVPGRRSKRIAALVEVSKEVVPRRQSMRIAARIAAGVEVSKEVVPRRQSKRIAARIAAGVEASKEVVPRRQSKRIIAASAEENKEEVVPKRQSKRIAARIEVSKEVVPKRKSKRRAVGYGVKETKENQEIVQEQVHTSVEGRPKRQNRKTPARGDQGTKEEKVSATCEGRPKRQNKRKEMEKEQAHSSIAEGRPKRQNRRMPLRYGT